MHNHNINNKNTLLVVTLLTLLQYGFVSAGELDHAHLLKTFSDDYKSGQNLLNIHAVSLAQTIDQKQTLSTARISVQGKKKAQAFHLLARSGEIFENSPYAFGQLVNAQGEALTNHSGEPDISSKLEFSSLIETEQGLIMLSQVETVPAAVYKSELSQDNNGLLSILNTRPLDFSHLNGGWLHCAASVTPWNTHLGSEEFEPDAAVINANTGEVNGRSGYLKKNIAQLIRYDKDNPSLLSPYNFGWQFEINPALDNDHQAVKKHYAMGRLSFELGYVANDHKTVYMTDDGTNVGLWMFIADQPGDLSSGKLYGAKWQQISANKRGGAARLQWINLGHATDKIIENIKKENIQFDDIFERAVPTKDECVEGFTLISTATGKECLKLQPGMAIAASRLETRRYGAMLGVTTEFRKDEGITYDPVHQRLFIAMTDIGRGMEDLNKYGKPNNEYDLKERNDIKLPYNRCGAIYALDLKAGHKDSTQEPISSLLVASNMYAVLSGHMTQTWDQQSLLPDYSKDGPFASNRCDLNEIANPDNISYIPEYNTMLIAEDSDAHENNILWAWDLGTGSLKRLISAPLGAEITSPYFYKDINGFAYIMSVIQHPFSHIPANKIPNDEAKNAYVGYFGPFKSKKANP